MRWAATLVKRLMRMAAIVLLVVAGSTFLIRFAPGYLSDAREMDPRYSGEARAQLSHEAARSQSLSQMIAAQAVFWAHGSLGISRQYEVPVGELVLPRLSVTGGLLLRSILLAWSLALAAALLVSCMRSPCLLWQAPSAMLLAVPTAAMATLCLLAGGGGPVLVMTLLLAARDFKFIHQVLRKAWSDPHLLQARAQGIGTLRLISTHILPNITSQLLALATLSVVTALSALVPVEVIFDVPGLGQLAWNAALNRDLPVLLAVTILMATAVTVAGMPSNRSTEWQEA